MDLPGRYSTYVLEKTRNGRTKVLIGLLLLIAGGAAFFVPGVINPHLAAVASARTEHSPAAAPAQHRLPAELSQAFFVQKGDDNWQIIPRAGYRIAARVLHSKQYDDWQAGLAPVDLALGWGMLSEPRIDNWISWNQDNRWYYYNYRNVLLTPFPREYVRDHSANVHIIPASEQIEAILRELNGNEIVQLDGLLVDVEAQREGRRVAFRTSLSRHDEGDESCEIMYVERVIKDGVEYR